MDYAQEAKRHRDNAEAMRVRGEFVASEGMRAQYFWLADYYDELADSEEQLAGNLKNSNHLL